VSNIKIVSNLLVIVFFLKPTPISAVTCFSIWSVRRPSWEPVNEHPVVT